MGSGPDSTSGANHAAAVQAHLSDCNGVEQTAAADSDRSTLVEESTPMGYDSDDDILTVSIDEGDLNYVVVTAVSPSPSNLHKTFIYSRKNAQYHVNVAIELLPKLRKRSYTDIQITGGGRIMRDDKNKIIHISGCSYGFGQADHAMTKELVEQTARYSEYHVTW